MGDLVNTVAWGTEAWVGQSPHAELTLHSVGSYLVTQASWSIYCPPNLIKPLCGLNEPRDMHVLSRRLLIQDNCDSNTLSWLQGDLLDGKWECQNVPVVTAPSYLCCDQIPNKATSKQHSFL